MSKKFEQEPQDFAGRNVTLLALTETEARQYHFGTEYITRLPNDIDAAQLEKDDYGRWFVINEKDLPHPFNPGNKQRLTNNIYGYLTYYDLNVRPNAPPHTLFIQWGESAGDVNSVTVWIKPAPVIKRDTTVTARELSDPPRPKVPPPPPME